MVLYWVESSLSGGLPSVLLTSRLFDQPAFQFVLALWPRARPRRASSGGRRSIAITTYSDTAHDVHSPRHKGFIYAHFGWIFVRQHDEADLSKVADLTRYPELLWLHKYELLPPVVFAPATFLIAGWPALVVGFCWSTVVVYHGDILHQFARPRARHEALRHRRDSRNNWLLALFTMGEGWHNNHHAYQAAPGRASAGGRSTRRSMRHEGTLVWVSPENVNEIEIADVEASILSQIEFPEAYSGIPEPHAKGRALLESLFLLSVLGFPSRNLATFLRGYLPRGRAIKGVPMRSASSAIESDERIPLLPNAENPLLRVVCQGAEGTWNVDLTSTPAGQLFKCRETDRALKIAYPSTSLPGFRAAQPNRPGSARATGIAARFCVDGHGITLSPVQVGDLFVASGVDVVEELRTAGASTFQIVWPSLMTPVADGRARRRAHRDTHRSRVRASGRDGHRGSDGETRRALSGRIARMYPSRPFPRLLGGVFQKRHPSN